MRSLIFAGLICVVFVVASAGIIFVGASAPASAPVDMQMLTEAPALTSSAVVSGADEGEPTPTAEPAPFIPEPAPVSDRPTPTASPEPTFAPAPTPEPAPTDPAEVPEPEPEPEGDRNDTFNPADG
jgi:outer membrane biosynthesis protein TonB